MPLTTSQPTPAFLSGGGELGALTRAFDWQNTPLGPPDHWPPTLRTTLGILLRSAFPMFLYWGPDLICFYNDAFRPSLGEAGKHPAVGKRGREVWAEAWDSVGAHVRQVMTTGEAIGFENRLIPIYRNGRLEDAYWTYSSSPVHDDAGQVSGVLVTCLETTGQINALKRLEVSEQRFQNLVREASVGIVVLSGEEMRVDIINDAYGRLIDRNPDELFGQRLFSVIPEAEAVFRPIIDSVRTSGEPQYLYDQPYSVRTGGTEKAGFLNLVYQPYREQDGQITGVMILCQDVTEQKKAEQALAEHEERFRNLIDSAPYPIGVYVGRDMRIQFANPAIIQVYGKGNDVIGKRYAEILPELENQAIFAQLDHVYTTGEAFHARNQRVDIVVDGKLQPYYFNYSFTPLFDADGRVYGILNTGADVTDLALAKQQVEKVEASLRGAVELAELATWSMDVTTGRFTYNQRFMDWLGFSEATKDMDEAYNPLPSDYRQPVADAIAAAVSPGSSGLYENEHPIINRLSGQVRIIHAQAQVFYDVAGQPATLSGTAQDVTKQRRLQQELERQVQERTEELAAANEELTATNENLLESNELLLRSNENLQRFAYVASHDLQEPLRKIQQFGDLLRNQYADQPGNGLDYLERILTAASRMSMLIKDLLAFSRLTSQRNSDSWVKLREIVETAVNDLEVSIQETQAEVHIDSLPIVKGNVSQLGQLFQNLLSNALKFRQPDRRPVVRVSSRLVSADELPAGVRPTRAVTAYHRIDVADNGIGFEDKYVDRIFQVFQRLHAKHQYAGTGIGLAICEKVAATHGGAITATSQLNQGATFSVYLPQ